MSSAVKNTETRNLSASDHIERGLDFECKEEWAAAAEAYRLALADDATGWVIPYSANNNLGYVLVQLGEYELAAVHCRMAIAINPDRYDAHKNLGLALQGQGLWADAARSFVEATMIFPKNARAWQHLEQLLQARPDLTKHDPELGRLIGDVRAELEQNNLIQSPIEPSWGFKPMEIETEH